MSEADQTDRQAGGRAERATRQAALSPARSGESRRQEEGGEAREGGRGNPATTTQSQRLLSVLISFSHPALRAEKGRERERQRQSGRQTDREHGREEGGGGAGGGLRGARSLPGLQLGGGGGGVQDCESVCAAGGSAGGAERAKE